MPRPSKLIAVAVLIVLALQISEAKRNFFAGRYRNRGLVPPPHPEYELDSARAALTQDAIFNFSQPLDHFNKSENRAWQQRYQVNDAEYKTGGPFFVMISGEAPLATRWLSYGQMYLNAKKHGALMFQPEHRFYGLSMPTDDASVENLRYLSSLQALADLDAFIHGMKQKYNRPDAKVVVFGGSYAGNLVVWYRALYPNTTIAGIASSAPVFAEVDFVEYMETVGNALKYFDTGCYEAVSDSFQAIQNLVVAKNDSELNALFGICQGAMNFSDPYEVEAFYDALAQEWMGAVQYNAAGNTSKVANYCRLMTDTQLGDPLQRYSLWFNTYSKNNDTPCIDVNWKDEVEELKEESWNALNVMEGMRQWLWQTCTEFGYYQTRDSKNQPFGYRFVDIGYIEATQCVGPFGITSPEIARHAEITNKQYGGRSPNATKVFLFNGSIDPWHELSVYNRSLSSDSFYRYIEGTSHCYDMHEALPTDPPQLTKAREDMAAQLTVWLADDNLSSTVSPTASTHSAGTISATTSYFYVTIAAVVLKTMQMLQ